MHPFEVMAEPVRRRIIDILASGEHSSGELAAAICVEFSISPTAVSKHLRRLLDAGFADVRVEWTSRIYRLSDEAIEMLEVEVAALRRKWDERIGWNGPGDRTRAGVNPGDSQPNVDVNAKSPPDRKELSNRGRRGKGYDESPRWG